MGYPPLIATPAIQGLGLTPPFPHAKVTFIIYQLVIQLVQLASMGLLKGAVLVQQDDSSLPFRRSAYVSYSSLSLP